jgi:hypothetical protein
MWVSSEYANELAVVSAWVALLVPWSVSTQSRSVSTPVADGEAGVLFFRFPLFELQFRDDTVTSESLTGEVATVDITEDLAELYPGSELFGDVFATTAPASATFSSEVYGSALQQAGILWTLASVGFVLAFLLSIALYVREDRVVAASPVSPVRLMGALLGVGALGTAGATVLHYTQRDVVGFPIPVGLVVIAALAAVLLRTEQVDTDA